MPTEVKTFEECDSVAEILRLVATDVEKHIIHGPHSYDGYEWALLDKPADPGTPIGEAGPCTVCLAGASLISGRMTLTQLLSDRKIGMFVPTSGPYWVLDTIREGLVPKGSAWGGLSWGLLDPGLVREVHRAFEELDDVVAGVLALRALADDARERGI